MSEELLKQCAEHYVTMKSLKGRPEMPGPRPAEKGAASFHEDVPNCSVWPARPSRRRGGVGLPGEPGKGAGVALSQFGLLSQTPTDRGACEQQKFTSQSPGDWRRSGCWQGRVLAGSGSGETSLPSSRLPTSHGILTERGRRGRRRGSRLSCDSSKGTHSTHEDPAFRATSSPHHLPNVPLPHSMTLWGRDPDIETIAGCV